MILEKSNKKNHARHNQHHQSRLTNATSVCFLAWPTQNDVAAETVVARRSHRAVSRKANGSPTLDIRTDTPKKKLIVRNSPLETKISFRICKQIIFFFFQKRKKKTKKTIPRILQPLYVTVSKAASVDGKDWSRKKNYYFSLSLSFYHVSRQTNARYTSNGQNRQIYVQFELHRKTNASTN